MKTFGQQKHKLIKEENLELFCLCRLPLRFAGRKAVFLTTEKFKMLNHDCFPSRSKD
jgi:hypothetical protein